MLGEGAPCCALRLSFPACKVLCDDSLVLPVGFWQGSHSFHST